MGRGRAANEGDTEDRRLAVLCLALGLQLAVRDVGVGVKYNWPRRTVHGKMAVHYEEHSPMFSNHVGIEFISLRTGLFRFGR
jgi:hypothetical protein